MHKLAAWIEDLNFSGIWKPHKAKNEGGFHGPFLIRRSAKDTHNYFGNNSKNLKARLWTFVISSYVVLLQNIQMIGA